VDQNIRSVRIVPASHHAFSVAFIFDTTRDAPKPLSMSADNQWLVRKLALFKN